MTDTKIELGLINDLVKKLEKLENSKESEGSEWSKVQTKDKKTKKSKGGIDAKIDPTNLNSVLSLIVQAITVLVDQNYILREHKVRIDELEKQNRAQGDLLDEIQQRSMKGNIILSGVPGKDKPSLIKSQEQLKQEKVTSTNYACQLIKSKYNVTVPENDIQACHYLPNNTILVRFWNRKEGTAWDHLTTEIKKGGKKEVGLFANFQLTSRRNSLMYHLRSMKKEGKISKLFSNENGQLGLKVSDSSEKKVISFVPDQKYGTPKTLNLAEIQALVNSKV